MITAFEAVCDVAAMGTIFSFCIAIGRELLSAAGTGEMIYGPLMYHLGVAIPPIYSAAIGAELNRLSAQRLHQQLSAVATAVDIGPLFYM